MNLDLNKYNFKKTEKDLWVGWHDYILNTHLNPNYGFYLTATLHCPRPAFLVSDRIEDRMYKIILHRHYDYKYFESHLEDNESMLVYRGFIESDEDLEFLLLKLGITEKSN